MEWVDEQPLHDFVNSASHDVLPQFASELRCLFRSMHERGVVYGDYSPKNIFVYRAHGRWRPRLVDYDALCRVNAPSDQLLCTGGQQGFSHPLRLLNPREILVDVAHTDAYAELVLYLKHLELRLVAKS